MRASPRVVLSGRGRGSGGLVALVLPLVLAIASVIRVSTPLLPPAGAGRGQTTGRRWGRGTLGDEGRGRGVGSAARHLHLLQKQHVAEVEEGGERCEERGDVSDGVEALIEALDDIGDEVGVGDRGADLDEGVGRGLLAVEVVTDGEVPLLDVVEFLCEVNLAGLLVVIEEVVDGQPHRVGGSDGSIGGSRGGHDEVDDVHSHGAVEPAENQGVEAKPCGIHGGLVGGEVIFEGVGGDGHGEEGAPLREDVRLEVEDDRNERPDVLNGGGLRP
jgi:hypothetical protein